MCVLQTGSSLQQKVDSWTKDVSATREIEAEQNLIRSNSVSSELKFQVYRNPLMSESSREGADGPEIFQNIRNLPLLLLLLSGIILFQGTGLDDLLVLRSSETGYQKRLLLDLSFLCNY